MTDNIFDFIGSDSGQWEVTKIAPVKGDALPDVSYLSIVSGTLLNSRTGLWTLKGVVSNLRYAERQEKESLVAIQEGLGRPQAKCAAFIPMRKSEAWWNLAQDERRAIFEQKSKHTQTGIKYLPAISRKLFHSRDLGQPFDFLTWFEFAPEYADAFEELVYALRQTEEWKYVEREVDVRLILPLRHGEH